MKQISIGLAGPKESGKSTAANFLVEKFGMVKFSFGDAVKEEVAGITLHGGDIPVELLDRSKKEPLLEKLVWDLQVARTQKSRKRINIGGEDIEVFTEGFDPFYKPTGAFCREILKLWGTEFRRSQDDLYWIKPGQKTVSSTISLGFNVVCDDVRFLNEMFFDTVWYIMNDAAFASRGDHPTENSIGPKDCNEVIDNNGPVSMLYFQINVLMEKFLNGQ